MVKTSDSFYQRAMTAQKAAAQAVAALKRIPEKKLNAATTLLAGRQGKILCIGVGKSGFIGMKLAATLTSFGHNAVFLHPVEALHGDTGAVQEGDVVVALSFSGNSLEVTRIAEYLKREFETPVIALTGTQKSPLAKIANVVLPTRVEKEGSPHDIAPMASTTSALVLGDMLAAALVDPAYFSPEHFAKYHPGGSLGLSLMAVAKIMRKEDEVPLVSSQAPLSKALHEMTDKKLGITGVVDMKGKLVGVITDGDVRRFFERYASIRGKHAHDAMSQKPKTTRENASLKEVLAEMEKCKITSSFVVDKGRKPVGIIHIHDIIERGIL